MRARIFSALGVALDNAVGEVDGLFRLACPQIELSQFTGNHGVVGIERHGLLVKIDSLVHVLHATAKFRGLLGIQVGHRIVVVGVGLAAGRSGGGLVSGRLRVSGNRGSEAREAHTRQRADYGRNHKRLERAAIHFEISPSWPGQRMDCRQTGRVVIIV